MMMLTAYIQYKNTHHVILAKVNPVSPWVEQREAHNHAFQNVKQKSGLFLLKSGCRYVSYSFFVELLHFRHRPPRRVTDFDVFNEEHF